MDVRLPDGTIITNVPDGTTQEELLRRLGKELPPQVGQSWVAKGDPVTRLMGGVAEGAREAIGSGAQFAVRGANVAGLAPDSEVERVEALNRQAAQKYMQERERMGGSGFDPGKLIGNTLVGAAATRRVGGAPTLPGRMAEAGGAGATAGALTSVEKPGDNADFFKQKLGQMTLGTIVAGTAQPLVELTGGLAAKIGKAAADFIRSVPQKMRGNVDTEQIVAQILAKQGVDFNRLNADVKQSIAKEVQEALKSYGGVSADAVRRKAEMAQVGIDNPLQSWVTRDPDQWTQTENLQGIAEVGKPLVKATADANAKLIAAINASRGMKGDVNPGRAFQGAARAVDAEDSTKIDLLYDTFRNLAPKKAGASQRFVNDIYGTLDSQMAMKALPPQIQGIVNDISLGKIPANASTLYQLQKMLKPGSDGSANYALKQLSGAIDRELDAIGNEAAKAGAGLDASQAMSALRVGREKARERFTTLETVPALKAVVDGNFAPEDFVSKYIVGADVKEVEAMWMKVGDQEFKRQARAGLVDAIKKAAIGASSDEAGIVSQAGLNKFLAQDGMKQKIRVILGDSGLEDIQRIARVSEDIIKAPKGSNANTSKASQALINFLGRTSGMPILGPLASAPLHRGINEMAVDRAAKSGAASLAPQGLVVSPELERLLRDSASLLGYAGGAGIVGNVSD